VLEIRRNNSDWIVPRACPSMQLSDHDLRQLDRARPKAVAEYLKDSRIEQLFLPPSSPNLNLIERFWKFFKRKVLYNRYHESFNAYKAACEQFFRELDSHERQLRSLLTENFEIIGN
jgi:transposase